MTTPPQPTPALTDEQLAALCAPLGRPVSSERLPGGLFAAVHAVTLDDGRRVVVKAGTADAARLLTYERGIIGTEAAFLRLVHATPEAPSDLVPQLLHEDRSRTAFPGDAVVMTYVDGVPWSQAAEAAERAGAPLDPATTARVQRAVGGALACLHRARGSLYGYPAPEAGLARTTWPDAFAAMIEAVLDDAVRWGITVPSFAVREAVVRGEHALARVTTPRLVHGDLWAGNVLVDPATLEVTGVIDGERALFGDPLFDLMAADAMGTGGIPAPYLEGYRAAGGTLAEPRTPAAEDEALRLRLYRLYLHLVMHVEQGPRGPAAPEHRAHVTQNLDALVGRLGARPVAV
ncbi:phosphotransferase family protein [Luteimicrobium sp. DT211]|uniref:phosphotransferase family protein n=1 Tax=Luteimicrobium sp. DT211 TaxID=3393412 RepID=UPI003CEEA296